MQKLIRRSGRDMSRLERQLGNLKRRRARVNLMIRNCRKLVLEEQRRLD